MASLIWRTVRGAEWSAALLLTALIVCLHLVAATSAGALWRDEANTVAIATLPRIGDVWNNLQYDSFPMLWLLIVRGYATLAGPMNDPAFRALGFLIGVGVTGALWFYARTIRQSVPLVSLTLLGMSPSMIRWGDTVRAYGFGILLSVLTCALLWRFIEKPGAARFMAAAVAAIASVQVLYYNAVALLAFCAGALVVFAYRRAWRNAIAVVVMGLLAAISLLPYANTIRGTSSWNWLVKIPNYTLTRFWRGVAETLSLGGSWMPAVWVGSLGLAVSFGVAALIFPKRFNFPEPDREVILFSLVALLVGIPGMFVFLRILSYPTNPWYYLSLLAVAAVCIDAIFGALRSRPWRIVRLAAVVIITVATLRPTERAVRSRLTNVDLAGSELERIARPGDVILVAPWLFGVSFTRYYHGTAESVTVPPLELGGFHRYDLLLRLMRLPDQTLPAQFATDRAAKALQSGHRVFVAGWINSPEPGVQPIVLPPAPAARGWADGQREGQWYLMVGQFLAQHSVKESWVTLQPTGVVNPYEDLALKMLEGWK